MTDEVTESVDIGTVRQWTIRRIEVRTQIAQEAWPVARLELQHPQRGRVTDIAKAPGAFDAVFIAASQIVGVRPRLLSYDVRSSQCEPGESLPIRVDIEIELNGSKFAGTSSGLDLVRCSLEAWLDAIGNSGAA